MRGVQSKIQRIAAAAQREAHAAEEALAMPKVLPPSDVMRGLNALQRIEDEMQQRTKEAILSVPAWRFAEWADVLLVQAAPRIESELSEAGYDDSDGGFTAIDSDSNGRGVAAGPHRLLTDGPKTAATASSSALALVPRSSATGLRPTMSMAPANATGLRPTMSMATANASSAVLPLVAVPRSSGPRVSAASAAAAAKLYKAVQIDFTEGEIETMEISDAPHRGPGNGNPAASRPPLLTAVVPAAPTAASATTLLHLRSALRSPTAPPSA